jgi:protease I
MANRLENKRVAFLATDGVEQIELTEPWQAVEKEGGKPELISLDSGEVQGFDHLDKDQAFKVDRTVREASADDYDGLVLPGGVANPDFLRADEDAVRFTRAFFEAGVVSGRTLTSWPSIKTDIRNAGGEWVDEEVHVDAGLVTSRKPDDLPAFCDKLVEEICEGRHDEQALQTAGSSGG